MRRFYNWTRGLNPWLPYLAVTFVFQIIRGANGDALIFGLACVLLYAEWKELIPWQFAAKPNYSRGTVLLGMVAAALVLYFSKRASTLDASLLLLMAPAVLAMVYYRDERPYPKPDRAMRTAKWLWGFVLVSMAVCEMFAYIWAAVFKDDKDFPTVSILVEPILSSAFGRSAFLVIWMLTGAGLLGLFKRRGVAK